MQTNRNIVMPLTQKTYEAYISQLDEWIALSEIDSQQSNEIMAKKKRAERLWKRLNKKKKSNN